MKINAEERKAETCDVISIEENNIRVEKVDKNIVEELFKADRKFEELCSLYGVNRREEKFPPSDKMKAVLKAFFASLDSQD